MENRRSSYRHAFGPERRIRVELTSATRAGPLVGEMMNLSIGGMAVIIREPDVPLKRNEQWLTRFTLPRDHGSFALESQVVHVQVGLAVTTCGLRFCLMADPEDDERRERDLWRFLLEEQRLERRRFLEGRARGPLAA